MDYVRDPILRDYILTDVTGLSRQHAFADIHSQDNDCILFRHLLVAEAGQSVNLGVKEALVYIVLSQGRLLLNGMGLSVRIPSLGENPAFGIQNKSNHSLVARCQILPVEYYFGPTMKLVQIKLHRPKDRLQQPALQRLLPAQ